MAQRKNATWLSLFAVVALIVAACSGTAEENGEVVVSPTTGEAVDSAVSSDQTDADATGSADEPSSDESFETWTGSDLPVAITKLSGSTGRVAYETDVGDATAMIVIDAATGDELARFDSDPAGRIGGVQSTPPILDDVLFVVGPLTQSGDSTVQAIDLPTLETLWDTTLFSPTPPDTCGGDLCITERNGTINRFDPTTGELLDQVSFTDTRVVGAAGAEFELRPRSTGRTFVALNAHGDHGFEALWSVSSEELEAAANQLVSPNTGWDSSFDEESNTIAQWLGSPWPEELPAEDTRDFVDLPYGAAFGLDADTGEILWAVADVGTCDSLDGTGFMALCRRSSTLGDFEDPRYQTDLVEVFEIATGEVAWSYPFDEQVPLWDVEVSVVDGKLAVDVGSERVALEALDGLETEAEAEQPTVYSCQLVAAEFIELDGLTPPRTNTEFIVPARLAPCLADGTVITPTEAVSQFGQLPSDFGTKAGNGWSVWAGEDGRPNGILVPEPQS